MDTSSEYIKMCEKSTEIQDIKKAKSYPSNLISQFWQTSEPRIVDIDGDTLAKIPDDINFAGYHYIWLPRQDQLQDMVSQNLDELIFDFATWAHLQQGFQSFWYGDRPKKIFTSMEQLWLARVMHEKYEKKWNGEDWVKE